MEHTYGEWQDGEAQLSVELESKGKKLGVLRLGARSSRLGYTKQDEETLRAGVIMIAAAIRPVGGAR